jgi:hypothetical protein
MSGGKKKGMGRQGPHGVVSFAKSVDGWSGAEGWRVDCRVALLLAVTERGAWVEGQGICVWGGHCPHRVGSSWRGAERRGSPLPPLT